MPEWTKQERGNQKKERCVHVQPNIFIQLVHQRQETTKFQFLAVFFLIG